MVRGVYLVRGCTWSGGVPVPGGCTWSGGTWSWGGVPGPRGVCLAGLGGVPGQVLPPCGQNHRRL